MGQPYVGEVRLVGFNFAPQGWMTCQGQQIAISENTTLFQLVGTTYGGDGQQTFNLPDLQGRTPINMGSNGSNNYVIGQKGGVETVTLTTNQIPAHTHNLQASSNAVSVNTPTNNTVGANIKTYSSAAPATAMNGSMIGSSGGSLPHQNLQPYLVLNWVISMFGIFPTQS
jgi:microcystin-dependent protein